MIGLIWRLVIIGLLLFVVWAALDGQDTLPGWDSPLPPRSELPFFDE